MPQSKLAVPGVRFKSDYATKPGQHDELTTKEEWKLWLQKVYLHWPPTYFAIADHSSHRVYVAHHSETLDRPEIIDEVARRLEESDIPVFHPLILPTIFAEMERDRQVGHKRECIRQLVKSVVELEKRSQSAPMKLDPCSHGMNQNKPSMNLWLKSIWTSYSNRGPISVKKSWMYTRSEERIRSRIRDLITEYEEHIFECTGTMDAVTLSTQMEWNHIGRMDAETNQSIARTTLKVAEMTRRDGRLMKSIAIVTMIFLPATFVADYIAIYLDLYYIRYSSLGTIGWPFCYCVLVAASE
ncbi:hypothetical protein GQ53DRAFT_769665 [Thozetella sp. PMI_491]|nr:hypothetical protein GQ53DRAFT_769665 [Thozetella sp. PMI_491]